MQIGIVLATVMVALMTTLSPESSYAYEAVMMTFLGLGLGLVMPVMNIAVQNEFKQMELGVATSSVQLFRGLGSTVGIALFGAILTSGIASSLVDVKSDPYLQTISQSPAAKQIGSFDDSNTLLTLNAPDVKDRINEGFEKSTATLSESEKSASQKSFETQQVAYASKITHAFSNSLNAIFSIAAVLMAIAAVLVMAIRERELAHASPNTTPGEM